MQTTQRTDKAARPVARPVALAVDPGGIPAELKQLKRWVLWRYEWDGTKGKWGKPPASPANGHKTSVQRPGGWARFDAALRACEAGKGKADGIGIVLSSGPDDPLDLAGIDVDDPALVPLLRPLGTYTEAAPTAGKGGAHALFRGKLPEGHTCRAAGAEVYESGRYFTVTGRRLADFPGEIARPDPDTLATVLRALGLLAAPAPPPPVEVREAVEAKPSPEDDRRLAAAFAASNGAAFRRLWDGDAGDYLDKDGRPDTSRADLALCNFLAFYWEKDPAAVDRMFRRSGLFRPEKWNARHYQTGETYGQHTVNLAVRDCRATYTGRRHTSNGEAVGRKASTASPASTGGGGAGAGAPPSADGQAPAGRAGAADGLPGIAVCDLPDAEPNFFWEPYVERGILSLVCGRTGAGKSHLLAHLAGIAARPVFLAGFEEGAGGKLRRRCQAAGVDTARARVLPRRYYLPSQTGSLLADLRALRADLCIMDPMISYIDPGLKSTDEDAVRPFLEALATLAADLGAPVVGVRHSGKGRNPVKGSTAWEEVPRSILELLKTEDGTAKRVLRHYKAGGEGPAAPAAYFEIAGPRGAGRFVLGRPVDPALACSLDAASDPEEGGKIEEVQALIKVLMSEGEGVDRREAGWMLRYCQTQVGCSAATVQRARRMLGVTSKSDMHGPGTKHYWHPPEGGWPE